VTKRNSAKKGATVTTGAEGPEQIAEDERTFYAYGYKIGKNLATSISPSEPEAKAISRGLRDAIMGKHEAVDTAVYLPKVDGMVKRRQAAKSEEAAVSQ
jgi:hypothetical protein